MPAPTTRSFRRVSIKHWPVSSLADDRYQRLLSGPDPLSLLLRLVSEAEVAAQAKRITAKWQEADECPGYWRVVAQIPLPVQAFAGSLEGYRARKGVLITTSDFTSDAREYVTRIEKRIVLINGTELADLLIEHGVGVTEVTSYTLKRIDSDYFDEDAD
jgi:hypothetical protein